LTAQGPPRAIFKLAIERGNVTMAEATAREFALSLDEALQLVLLYAAYEPAKVERAALRWFRRYLGEGKGRDAVQSAGGARGARCTSHRGARGRRETPHIDFALKEAYQDS
jgi:hypothetical protein